MPVRTSSVVALGMLSLVVIGVVSIFGNAILAVVSPVAEPRAAVAGPAAAAPPPSAKPPGGPSAGAPAAPPPPSKDASS